MPLPPKVTEEREAFVKQVVEDIRAGKPPFWDSGNYGKPQRNLIADMAGKDVKYHGINDMILTYISEKRGYTDNRWATFKQIQSLQKEGIPFKDQPHLKKGVKGVPIEYWQFTAIATEKDPKTGKEKPIMKPNPETGKEEPLMKELSRPLVRRYIVFNASQIENVPPAHPFTIDEKDWNDAMEAMLKNSEASIHYDQANANYYNSRKDEIHVMKREDFKSLGDFYATCAHEIAHSTGAKDRLERPGITQGARFGSETYAKEELRAEMASLFLSQEYGIQPDKTHYDNHIAYLESWADVLEKDPNELFRAASDAAKITEYMKSHMIEKDHEQTKDRTTVQDCLEEARNVSGKTIEKRQQEEETKLTPEERFVKHLSVTIDSMEGVTDKQDRFVLGGGHQSFREDTPARDMIEPLTTIDCVKDLGGHFYKCGKAYTGEALNKLVNDFIKDDATHSYPQGYEEHPLKACVTIKSGDKEIKDTWELGNHPFSLPKEKNGTQLLLDRLADQEEGKALLEGLDKKALEAETKDYSIPSYLKNPEVHKKMIFCNTYAYTEQDALPEKTKEQAIASYEALKAGKDPREVTQDLGYKAAPDPNELLNEPLTNEEALKKGRDPATHQETKVPKEKQKPLAHDTETVEEFLEKLHKQEESREYLYTLWDNTTKERSRLIEEKTKFKGIRRTITVSGPKKKTAAKSAEQGKSPKSGRHYVPKRRKDTDKEKGIGR